MYWDEINRSVHKIPVRVVRSEDPPIRPAEQSGEVETAHKQHRSASGEVDWQTLALHMQADMDNFRKRQARRADEAIVAERERLLRLMLPVADNLARALSHNGQGDETLRQGVELTYRELMRLLEAEGVTPIEAMGQPFTPDLHEAVATIAADAEAGAVVEELEPGYRLGDKLLRPARVVVAA
jgi:molecular chaperone GrpE